MSFSEANLFAPAYEDPKQSSISDDVGYAPTPLGPDGKRARRTPGSGRCR